MEQAIDSLSKEQVKALLTFLHGDRAQPMDILFEVMLVTGVRSHEMVKVSLGCFDTVKGELEIRAPAKGSNSGVYDLKASGLNQRLEAAIVKANMTLFYDDPIIWCFTRNRPNAVAAKLWLRRRWIEIREELFGFGFKKGLHILRHTFARNLRQIATIEQMQQMLRHKSLGSTMHYLARPTKEQGIVIHQRGTARLYGIDEGEEGSEG